MFQCENAKKRTGIPNTGRFQNGHKLGKRYKQGDTPWTSGKKGAYTCKRRSESKQSAKCKEWTKKVKERDGFKCIFCECEKTIHAHHIKPWKDYPELRFDMNNGISLCGSCHAKEEGFKLGQTPWNKK